MLDRHYAGAKQSKVELERGFTITRPIPMIYGDELRITVKAADVYLELLERFCDDGLVVKAGDDHAFIRLIFQNDVFLERHWKKLLRDVRRVPPRGSERALPRRRGGGVRPSRRGIDRASPQVREDQPPPAHLRREAARA